MFNVYKNQLSRQTGSRNLTGPKTLPTIWYTYMMLLRSPKGEGVYCFTSVRPSKIFFVAFFSSNCWWHKSDIWSKASYRNIIFRKAPPSVVSRYDERSINLNKVVAIFEKHSFLSQTDLTRTGIISKWGRKWRNSKCSERKYFYFVGITF
jgi:hypothetical protein